MQQVGQRHCKHISLRYLMTYLEISKYVSKCLKMPQRQQSSIHYPSLEQSSIISLQWWYQCLPLASQVPKCDAFSLLNFGAGLEQSLPGFPYILTGLHAGFSKNCSGRMPPQEATLAVTSPPTTTEPEPLDIAVACWLE